MDTLALETLTDIWVLLKHSPRTLATITQVSNHWRTATTGIPQLWTAPYITESTDMHLLRVQLERAQGLPLFIDIDFRISANELSIATEFTSEGPQKFNAILDVLKPFSQTWRHFTVFGPFYLDVFLKTCFSASLPTPQLIQISIDLMEAPAFHTYSGTPHADSSFQHAPPLLAVRTNGYPQFWGNFAFGSLTALTLGWFVGGNILGWNMFAEAASNSPNLSSIAFIGEIPSTVPVPNGGRLLDLVLPDLTSLSITHIHPTHLLHLIHHLVAPDLRSLAMCLADSEQDFLPFVQAFPLHFPSIEKLAIEMLALNEVAQLSLVTFFAPLPHLTTLRLNFDTIPNALWQALINPAGDANFLPRLNELSLVDVPLHSLQELAFLRDSADHHISTISLHYTNHFRSISIHTPLASTTWLMDTTDLFLSQGETRDIYTWMG